jgi:excisionase family DNA binding protein
MTPTMLSVAQVAERCGVSRDAVRRAIRRGDLPAVKVFNRVRIDESDLAAYIERGRVGGGEVARRRRPAPRRAQSPRGSLVELNRDRNRKGAE